MTNRPSCRRWMAGVLLAALAAAFPAAGSLRGQTPTATVDLDSLQAELARVARELSQDVQTTVEANVRSGQDAAVIRSEVLRFLEVRRSELESLRSQIAQAIAAQRGRVTGKVTHAGTGEPVRSVLVHVEGFVQRVVTGPDGTFTIPGVPGGSHTVVAQRLGFDDARQPAVVVTPGSDAEVAFRLEPRAVALQGIAAGGSRRPTEVRVVGAAGNVERVMMPTSVGTVRGQTGSREPLIVVDGVVVSRSSPLVLGQRFVAGAGLVAMSPSLAPYFDVDEGVLVTEVTDPSPGFDAGLRAGDVLVEVAGQRVTTIDEVREAFATSPSNGAGAGVPLRVVRAGSTLELYVPR